MTSPIDPSTLQPGDEIEIVARSLTPTQRNLVIDGSVHGDFTMRAIRGLQRKRLFRLVIDSPNGQCGFMELTPLGRLVQAHLKAVRV